MGVYWIHPVRPSFRPSVRLSAIGVRMIIWIFFIRFQFFSVYVSLGWRSWDWIWASYLIKCPHNGWSCDFLAFLAFLKSIFQLEPSSLIFRETLWGHMIKVPGFVKFQYLNFSQIFYAFLNEPGCSIMSAWCPDDNLNHFHWISNIF